MAIALILVAASLAALTIPRGEPFHDDLIEHLIGRWQIKRVRGQQIAHNVAKAEWVLGHQFVRIHMIDEANPPRYEADVYIGWDTGKKTYVAHWMDNFGGTYSLAGSGEREDNAIVFLFSDESSEISNTYAWDGKRWTSTIIQREKGGEWKPFCVDTYTRG